MEDLRKVYDDDVVAVHGASVEVQDGEFVVLVGPSGCGKSTTLRMIAGLESITSGQLWIGNQRVNDVPPKDRDVAMVFQNYALYPHMSVRENMSYGLKLTSDLSDEEVAVLDYEVTDEDVENEVENLRRREADLVPLSEDDPVEEDHLIVFDIQEIDPESNTPIIGKKDEDQQLLLDDERLDQNPLTAELKKAVVGSTPGDSVRFTVSHDQAHGEHTGHHAHRFEVTIKDAKRRELRELDDEFVQDATDGQIETVDELRERIRQELEQTWERQARSFIEGNIAQRMMELHDVPVPRSAVEVFLDAFVDDVRRRNDGELPENFDETYFREQNRNEAEQQARWMVIRDKVVEEADLEVTDEDRQAFFEEQAEGQDDMTAERIEGLYRQMPNFIEQLDQRLLSQKVYDELAERFKLVEKDVETIEQEHEARHAAQHGESEAEAESASSPIITG